MGCSPWGREELDTTELLHFHFSVSCIGEGNGNPLQFSCLENPRDWGAWWAAVCGVAQSWTVRGSSLECQAATAQERPRGAPRVRGQGWRPRGTTPRPRSEAPAERSNPTPEARGSSQEEQPHVQGAVAAQAQEGLEEPSHIEGQEGWR